MIKPTLAALCLGAVCTSGYLTAFAQTAAHPATTTNQAGVPTAPDNTKSNKHEPIASTADAQTNSASDIDIAKRIRQSVMADKSLSTYAHNVKIVAVNGKVTLNGVVRSQDEKRTIEMKATQVVGKNLVVNDITVKPDNPS